jgi:RNA polymerase sigma-70 factor (ECF subfamily)
MTPTGTDLDMLLDRAAAGDPAARDELLARYRGRLVRAVAARVDPRVAARADPSDVVQDALLDAAARLPDYLAGRPLPFFPWLRRLALDRLARLHRDHRDAGCRAVTREESDPLPDRSAAALVEWLAGPGPTPSGAAAGAEDRDRVLAALTSLPGADREILVLLYLEGLSAAEAAVVLGIAPAAARARHLRALERLRAALGGGPPGEPDDRPE